ncbi:MAG: cytochrome c family protein [Candidatus Xenolissoclinum pacificiensis L6]|uniref:Cytochrome c homolog n=1 Tax=Candidatus Xenolissoclinum pacificiensis L6 TaxID=1401685 RepID=W2UZ55_9RICK|nr:MAG: cytochrome c family protein [Candidatus Xenolissoclinum pacificiensis L6]
MKGLEGNKIFASVLLAFICVLGVSHLVDMFYKPDELYFGSDETSEVSSSSAMVSMATSVDIYDLFKKADIDNGVKVARKCQTCHDFSVERKQKIGPGLRGIVGAKKARDSDYNYSKDFYSLTGTWTYRELFMYLHSPKGVVAKTKMSFVGIKKYQDIVDLIVYLNTLSDTPVAEEYFDVEPIKL